MRVRRVYIKKAGGEIASEACYTAWRGFSHLAYPLDFFDWQDLISGSLLLDRLTLVVGGTVTVHKALRQIGVATPKPLNVPEPLLKLTGRRVWETTLGAVRQRVQSSDFEPVFVKPLAETKSFQGKVVSSEGDLRDFVHLDDALVLQAAEPVSFVSEWRYYVHHSAVVGIAHYKGDWSQVPDCRVVQQAIADHSRAPVAYSLDFGVAADGRTLLIEANDAFALGTYGIDAVAYAKMLEDRWLEITSI